MSDLTPGELVRPLAGVDWWHIEASGDVPAIKVSDGPSGVRGDRFAGGPSSVSFPCGAALGASWDVDLVRRVGAGLAAETMAKGAHVLLGPTVNLQRTPLGGRHFECFSEDPVLTAHLAVAYVEGLQAEGIGACVKHLVANDQEEDRFEISSELDERTLREVSLLPFEHALRRAGSWSTMAAYNRLHGTHCSEHPRLLTTILRDEWGWDGVVISDWFAVHSTVESALAGLDLEMPGPPIHWGPALAEAVASGTVPTEVILAKRERLRLLGLRTGADTRSPGADATGGAPAEVTLAREAAVAALTLLRNEAVDGAPVLPLADGATGTIAVLGPNADREVVQGGGSARVTPTDVVTIAGGLRERYGDRVVVEEGVRATRGTPALDGRHLRRADGGRGVDVELVGADGAVRHRLAPRDFRLVLLDETADDAEAAGWTGRATSTFMPARSGAHRFKVKTNGEVTFTVDGRRLEPVDDTIDLEAGRHVPIELTAEVSDPAMRLAVEVRCAQPEAPDAFERAVAAAVAAEVAVVVVGLDNDWETEGRDRTSLELPGRQVELVRAVAAVQPRTVVAVVAGSPVDLSWADEVPALLWCWLPGQEGGRAVADVISGAADPGGRLPCTLPTGLAQTPALLDTPPDPGVLRYQEGVFCGHRWYDVREIDPAFPFGHGLSYTTFELSAPRLASPTVDPDGRVAVEVDVRNTGCRAGTEVVQVYIGDPVASVRRPIRELRGFAKVTLDAGASTTVELELTMRDLAFWDARASCWRAEAGQHTVWAGQSSRRLGPPSTLELTGDWTATASDPLP